MKKYMRIVQDKIKRILRGSGILGCILVFKSVSAFYFLVRSFYFLVRYEYVYFSLFCSVHEIFPIWQPTLKRQISRSCFILFTIEPYDIRIFSLLESSTSPRSAPFCSWVPLTGNSSCSTLDSTPPRMQQPNDIHTQAHFEPFERFVFRVCVFVHDSIQDWSMRKCEVEIADSNHEGAHKAQVTYLQRFTTSSISYMNCSASFFFTFSLLKRGGK